MASKFKLEQDLEMFEKRYTWKKVDMKEIKFLAPEPSTL